MHTTLHRNIAFRRLSPTAKLTFYVCLELAGDLEQGGAIAVRGLGPVSAPEIADEVGLSERAVEKALEDLVTVGFFSRRLDGAYVVEKWDEKTSTDPTGRDRQRRRRDRQRDASVTVTGSSRDSHALEEEEEEEEEVEGEMAEPNGSGPAKPSPKRREEAKPCPCLGTIPLGSADDPEASVDLFLGVFANCRREDSRAKHRPNWLGWIREMVAEGFNAEEIWSAFATAHIDANHAPIRESRAAWSALRLTRKVHRLGLEVEPVPRAFVHMTPTERSAS